MRAVFLISALLLAGCASQALQPVAADRQRHADPAKDRAECMQEAALKVQNGPAISFGGRNTNNLFVHSAAFTDCIVARGYRPDELGNFLAVPDQQRQMGN